MSIWFYKRDRLGRRQLYSVNVSLMLCVVFAFLTAEAVRSFVFASFWEQVGALSVLAIGVLLLVLRRKAN